MRRIVSRIFALTFLFVLIMMFAVSRGLGADGVLAKDEGAKGDLFASVESSLESAGERIRQFAFDGDAQTYFASEKVAAPTDHFTLILDRPARIKSIVVTTGKPDGTDKLAAGSVEISMDGKMFIEKAKFQDGEAHVWSPDGEVRAIRVKPAADCKTPLVVREIALESNPKVVTFKYPVEFTIDVADAPEMKEWAEKAVRACERSYTMINDELASDGFTPPRTILMTLKSNYRGVAATGGDRIIGSVRYFKDHPDDIGAMVHETVHVVQSYRRGNNPSWLVEGISDYIRFFKYEPGKLKPPPREQARFNRSYRISAAFLAYLTEKYDKDIIRKLNKAMRQGEYDEKLFQEITGKSLGALGDEWRDSLGKN
jgi:hypothetical protein